MTTAVERSVYVRIWDASMNLAHTIDAGLLSAPRPGRREVEVPHDSPVAEFVQDSEPRHSKIAYITIDGPGPDDRWMGRLTDYEVRRTPKHDCPNCQHGNKTTVRIGWE
jgi:hypothetical protein